MINDELDNPTGEVANVFVDYYKHLMGTKVELGVEEDFFSRLKLRGKASPELGIVLSQPVLEKEIHDTVFSMEDNKSPRLDGFTAYFFKSCWSVIRNEYYSAIKHIFETNYMPSGINATFICLIPKTPNPTFPGDFRPISCCNVVYVLVKYWWEDWRM